MEWPGCKGSERDGIRKGSTREVRDLKEKGSEREGRTREERDLKEKVSEREGPER